MAYWLIKYDKTGPGIKERNSVAISITGELKNIKNSKELEEKGIDLTNFCHAWNNMDRSKTGDKYLFYDISEEKVMLTSEVSAIYGKQGDSNENYGEIIWGANKVKHEVRFFKEVKEIPFTDKRIEFLKKIVSWNPEISDEDQNKQLDEIDNELFPHKTKLEEEVEDAQRNEERGELNLIFYGPSGAGKTYQALNKAIEIVEKGLSDENKSKKGKYTEKYKEYREARYITFITFHQGFTYEKFMEGTTPLVEDGGKEINAKQEAGVFYKLCSDAKKKPNKNFVLIIDEMNRGNIANIFGELLTLVGKDKRNLSLTLSNGEDFSVPDNIYIIGTMNITDKTLYQPGIALRRRFKFEKVNVEYEKNSIKFKYADEFKSLNAKINEKKNSSDFEIGHGYFMELKNEEQLIELLNDKIIPFLIECFGNEMEEVVALFKNFNDKVEIKMENYSLIAKKICNYSA